MTSPTTRQLADQYFSEQESRLGKVAPPPPIGKMLAAELRCHQATLSKWIQQHRGDDIPAVKEAFLAAVEAIERVL